MSNPNLPLSSLSTASDTNPTQANLKLKRGPFYFNKHFKDMDRSSFFLFCFSTFFSLLNSLRLSLLAFIFWQRLGAATSPSSGHKILRKDFDWPIWVSYSPLYQITMSRLI